MATRAIILVGNPLLNEIACSDTPKPGMIMEREAAGTVKAHATEGGAAERLFALEDSLQGKTVDQAYAAGDRVRLGRFKRGEKLQVLLKAGVDVAIGEVGISAGDGKFIGEGDAASATTVADRIVEFEEALDLTASAAVDTLVAARVL